jgi:hypothetical protein
MSAMTSQRIVILYVWLHLVLDGVVNLPLQNASGVQQGGHSPIIGLHRQVLESQNHNPRGVGSRGQKARCRSPQRRGTEEKTLAVSTLSRSILQCASKLTTSE